MSQSTARSRGAAHPFAAGLLAVFVTIAATLASTVAVIAPVSAQTDGADPPDAAASWLADQLVDGDHFNFPSSDFADAGLTIDGLIAFAAAGVAENQAAAATALLGSSETTTNYSGDGTSTIWAGGTAKLVLAAQVRGLDPTSWGEDDIDLVARLKSREQINGRFTDESSFGDFSNVFGQSLALIVLVRQPGETPTDSSIDLLLESQCADGGFALELEPDPADCGSGVDTSAIALQALLATGRPIDSAAIDDVVAYLLDAQQAGGGFADFATGSPNANSTGVAVQALSVAGEDDAAADGATFLRSLQQDCSAPESDRGGIAFDDSGFDTELAIRATAQAVPGMAGVGLLQASSTGAGSELPRFECPATDPGSGGPTGSAAGSGAGPAAVVIVGDSEQSPAATPVIADPDFTG